MNQKAYDDRTTGKSNDGFWAFLQQQKQLNVQGEIKGN